MNKIIKGRRYDTEKAKEIGYYSHLYRNDFNFFMETLYKKRNGEYFLYGEGGAASKYAECVDQNTMAGGEKIIPLTYEEAREWGEKYLDTDEYESIFGKTDEGSDDTQTVRLNLKASEIELLQRYAVERKISMSEAAGRIIRQVTA